jgi:hypothetical protein
MSPIPRRRNTILIKKLRKSLNELTVHTMPMAVQVLSLEYECALASLHPTQPDYKKEHV